MKFWNLFILLSLFFYKGYSADAELSTGEWHKISITQDGMYKLNYAFLQDNISGSSSLSFSDFGVFGLGLGMVPEENAVDRPVDIVEMPLVIQDNNGNGVWNDGDYILFYGKGPDNWYFNAETEVFRHEKNIYTDVATYFITTTNGGTHNAPLASALTPSVTTINTYHNRSFFEEDENNLLYSEQISTMGSGRAWYGETLSNVNPTKTFSLNFENLVAASQIALKGKIAASGNSSSTFNLKNNGASVLTQSVSSVGNNQYPPIGIDGFFQTSIPASATNNFEMNYSSGDPQAHGFIDYIEAVALSNLSLTNSSMDFRNYESTIMGSTGVNTYRLSGANANTVVWDVTKAFNIEQLPTNMIGALLEFSGPQDSILREYVAFNSASSNHPLPTYVSEVENQNLHGLEQIDYVIITTDELMEAADRLDEIHSATSNLTVAKVTVEEIYNEFGSGQPDLSALRDFLKYLYDSGLADNSNPKYCLLLGDASFDYKDKYGFGENMVPTYESPKSLSTLNSYATDDYIGLLDDEDGGTIDDTAFPDLLDIAIGRIPASTLEEANGVVNKIEHYLSRASFGDWRNKVTFIADDEDNDLHFRHAEELSAEPLIERKKYYNYNKIYLDSYSQINASGGDRYPDVVDAILRELLTGALVVDYIGHGGPSNWAQERVFNIDDIRNLSNIDNLPLFITATCDFAPFDDPGFHSAGENLLTNPNGGAIAMISTTRLVYASQNKELNRGVLNYLFEEVDGRMPTIGEIIMQGKNSTSANDNNRKFMLLGDPALKLAYPEYEVVTTEINGFDVTTVTDTLTALSEVTIKGEVQENGVLLSSFDGIVYPTVYDKPTEYQTRANDPDSDVREYELQNNLLFKGKSSVVNGEFEFKFKVPVDINYAFENGKISYYVEQNDIEKDGHGYTDNFVVGGTAENIVPDNEGPTVELYMNDRSFQFGGITGESPLLIADLFDINGINTVGTGVGHDITALINEDTQEKFVLNDFYEADLDEYRSGTVRYPFNNLPDGRYRLDVKAWDVYNNPGESFTEFIVVSSEQLAIQNLLNYPNPFTQQTSFVFEHNRPGEELDIVIQVFDYSGKLVKTISETIQPEGTRLDSELTWDGSNDIGAPLSKGMYIYRLRVTTEEGLSAQDVEKMIILR